MPNPDGKTQQQEANKEAVWGTDFVKQRARVTLRWCSR